MWVDLLFDLTRSIAESPIISAVKVQPSWQVLDDVSSYKAVLRLKARLFQFTT